MRAYLPFILVGLAIFSAICVAVVASEIIKEASRDGDADDK
jgi:F0F1-type ATP synthase membrane subunit c/vacuolar-type H+-ATPase subunit K